jgi:predicted nucleic acid-binding protein
VNYLLDTNVISEWTKPQPNPGIVTWLSETDEDRIFISVVTLAELRYGVERMAQGARRARLDSWLTDELPLRFENRVLAVDHAVADHWGRLVARTQAVGRPIGAMDAFVAATADRHALALVTRNVSDFEPFGLTLINPWIA